MPLSTHDRAEFVALMPHLGADADDVVVSFVRDHWRDCLDEVRAVPGSDQVRAGLIRLMTRFLEADDDVHRALEQAAQVVRDYPDAVRAGDPTLLVHRHPAWVGLCALELATHDPTLARDPRSWAAALASAGFASLGPLGAGRGEVLWAMAEQAEAVGWDDRVRELLEAAADAPFAEDAHRHDVRFLLALRRLDDGHPEATALLEEIARSEDANPQRATHAAAILSELRREAGDVDGARYWLGAALDTVDLDDDPEVAERLRASLDELDTTT